MAVITWTSYDETRPGTEIGYHSNVNPDDLTKDQYYSVGDFEYYPSEYYGVLCRFDVTSSTSTVLFEAGTTYDYTFNGIVYSNNASSFTVTRIEFYYKYSDGTNSGYFLDDNANVVLDGYFANSGRRSFTVSSTHTPTKDVTRVWCRVFFSLARNSNVESGRCSGNMGYGNVDITINETSNSGSLLTSIKDKLTNIFSGISDVGTLLSTVRQRIIDGFDNLGSLLGTVRDKLTTLTSTLLAPLNTIRDKIGETLTNLINLPGQIWKSFNDGLQSLFVPNETFLLDYIDDWHRMLVDKFGALFQVSELMINYWESINFLNTDPEISIPAVTIPLPQNESFTFGPYDFRVIPEGFDFMAVAARSISAILITFMFIAGLYVKFKELLGAAAYATSGTVSESYESGYD